MPTDNGPSPYCHKCGNKSITNTAVQQKLKSHRKLVLHVELRCPKCGNEWWSRNKKALARARDMDHQRKTVLNVE